MTNQRSYSSASSSHPEKTRSLFSARKIALMASVVTGIGIAMYGVSPSPASFDIFSSAAHAQVSNALSSATQPTGFADMVERVKPSVISVKVTMKEVLESLSLARSSRKLIHGRLTRSTRAALPTCDTCGASVSGQRAPRPTLITLRSRLRCCSCA
jgi:hypothetical protein